MKHNDARIDEYIGQSAEFARPILIYLREIVHRACPEVTETIKWGFPHFEYKGILCSMAAFKEHAAFTFWKGALMKDPHQVMEQTGSGTAMGHFGRITRISDLPKRSILEFCVKEAARLNEAGAKLPPRDKSPAARTLKIPSYFRAALRANPEAKRTFDNFSPGRRREYVEWITEAKTAETRKRRLDQAVAWLEQGKPRNWKYMKKG